METYYEVIENYRDGGKWVYTYTRKSDALQDMRDMRKSHPARTYELKEIGS